MTSLRTHLRQLLQLFRSGSVEFNIRPYQKQLQKINSLGDRFRECDDSRLQSTARVLRQRATGGEPRARLLVEVFALVREVADRVLGMRPYDQQILAGLVLDQDKVAEMQTGEGKTLAAVAPAFLGSLSGGGVHLLTFNDCLSRRDAEWTFLDLDLHDQ